MSGAYIEVALIATGAISNSMIANLEDEEVRDILYILYFEVCTYRLSLIHI